MYGHNGLTNAEQLSSTAITSSNDDNNKLGSQTTTCPDHHQTRKRGDLSSNASVAWMALLMYHALSRRFAPFSDGSSFAQLRICMSCVGPMSCTICWYSSQPLSADVHILVPRGPPRAACSFRASSLPTYAAEEEPLQFASTTLFDASISLQISRRLTMKSICKFNTWQMSITTRLQQINVGAWDGEKDQPTSMSTPSFATHMILCDICTTCPHCRFVGLHCTTPL